MIIVGSCFIIINKEFTEININLAYKLIQAQFPEYSHLSITPVEKQGHDNRSYILGINMLLRFPSAAPYALNIRKEQEFLPKLAPYITLGIPIVLRMGKPCEDYPYYFSIYKYLPGQSINLIKEKEVDKEQLAYDLAIFLKELQNIKDVKGPKPGLHNWWRGDNLMVYNPATQEQINILQNYINAEEARHLWKKALSTSWENSPLWIHGDFAIGNMLMNNEKLSAIIDFGGMAMGDPACDLVIAWTYLSGKSREIFIKQMNLDDQTWIRARAWVLWKGTYELCQLEDKSSKEAQLQRNIIKEVLYEL